jgi:large conductance mechanosensitive channel
MLAEFKKFALRGNVVDLAVGVIIGAASSGIVNSLVGNLVCRRSAQLPAASIFRITFSAISKAAGTLSRKSKVPYWRKFHVAFNFIIIAFCFPCIAH